MTILDWIVDAAYSIPSAILHSLWFVGWFLLKLDINTLTLIVSLEAIYLAIFIGVTQREHHDEVKTKLGGEE